MGLPRFGRPASGGGEGSPNLYVANCGPAVGISHDTIASVFARYGQLQGVYAADETGARVIVCFSQESDAKAAFECMNGLPCPDLGGRALHIRYSMLQHQPTSKESVPVSLVASELEINGIYLWHDFITAEEELQLLAAVDDRPWIFLAKRRVQHYGYEFCYQTRNVDTQKHLGELPSFVSPVLEKIPSLPDLDAPANLILDQLTVNEYPPGVGLSPHIDTHSAFEGLIFSLSLAGPCIMEFRRYSGGAWRHPKVSSSTDIKIEDAHNGSDVLIKSIYLPPRSMLLLSEEGRYAWHHYIPHHKIDMVNNSTIKRGSRRVSFTLRKVRTGPCECEFPQYCDSRR
uniref:RNA-binding (RRM/RBD/RNP motifs) family protein n=1 Tax=Francoa sonchifolia TaxID=23250 RepID=A0A0G4APT1_9ROSI|nr:RNA-binding (RRM/RBD/RNP motifs) family protein [Francoa sonchifolia]